MWRMYCLLLDFDREIVMNLIKNYIGYVHDPIMIFFLYAYSAWVLIRQLYLYSCLVCFIFILYNWFWLAWLWLWLLYIYHHIVWATISISNAQCKLQCDESHLLFIVKTFQLIWHMNIIFIFRKMYDFHETQQICMHQNYMANSILLS